MKFTGGLSVALVTAFAAASGQEVPYEEIAKFISEPGAIEDRFGSKVAIVDDWAVVGAPQSDTAGEDAGSVTILRRRRNGWRRVVELTAPDADPFDRFGDAVATDGRRLIVGARNDDDRGDNAGAAYVFDRSGSTWTFAAKLTALDGASGDSFGVSVEIEGDRALVGAYLDDDAGAASGVAFAYAFDGVAWNQTQKLLPSDAHGGDQFGQTVALDGETAVVTAWQDDDRGSNSGSVYVFEDTSGVWLETGKLTAYDGSAGDGFGWWVDISGDAIVVGARQDDDAGEDAGSAYVFERAGHGFSRVFKLLAQDAVAFDNFGRTVAIDGERVIVGAGTVTAVTGSAYVYARGAEQWVQTQKLLPAAGDPYDQFGVSVDVSGGALIVGARFDDDAAPNAGSVSLFEVPPLSFDVTPRVVRPLDVLTVESFGAQPDSPAFLVTSAPALGWIRVVPDQYDGAGVFRFREFVPPGMSGLELECWVMGASATAGWTETRRQTVRFQ